MNESYKFRPESRVPSEYFEARTFTRGSKALLRLDSGLYVFYRRDHNTDDHPGVIDLIGGGADEGETGFEAISRESLEEIGKAPRKGDVTYARCYPSSKDPTKVAWFAHAELNTSFSELVLGDEGLELLELSLSDYLSLPSSQVYPFFQERTQEYLESGS